MTSSYSMHHLNRQSLGGGIVGVGIGTLVVYLAYLLGPGQFQKWLLFAAPTISVGGAKLVSYGIRRVIAWHDLKITHSAISEIQNYLKNPDTSDDHKANLRKQLEANEKRTIDLHEEQLLNNPAPWGQQSNVKPRPPKGRKRGSE